MRAIRIHEYGPPDVLRVDEISAPSISEGHVLVRTSAIGVNFKDIYHRRGQLKVNFPFIPGIEAAGTVEAVGSGVEMIKQGDRVAFVSPWGSYAEVVAVPAHQLVPLPDGIDLETGAAVLLQGVTAHYLTHSTFPLKPDDRCLVHAAAGGVGQLLCQMAKGRGAKVIATVSTQEKARVAREAGADEVILYTEQNFEVEVKRITKGRGVDVVYDSVGKTTFEKSMNCLRPRGMLVSYGNASGNPDPLRIMDLAEKGSLFVTRPTRAHYSADREELQWRSGDIFQWILSGELKIQISGIFDFQDAPEAHRLLEGRKTAGKLILTV
jgi:NADPH2:quinone reductase